MSENKVENNQKKIDGSPTKGLFVFILTRDLSVEDAINDLIDNCIDGAKRLRSGGDYNGLHIKINISKEGFKIEDNCGGIPVDLARNYAFRFGRPEEMSNTDYSIGQFGVGMKRAVFKLGTEFYVESKSSNSEFAVIVNVDQWLAKTNETGDDDWSFEFKDYKEDVKNSESETGTTIEVIPIHDNLIQYVSSEGFIDDLKKDIEKTHMENIHKGIKIFLNEEELRAIKPQFIISDVLKVAKVSKEYDNGVKVNIFTGLGKKIGQEGGWYIFCNDRLLLGPEQTTLTGWTGKDGGGGPSYHQQYHEFRGLVYFKAENAKDLPWNTSKNTIDASSPIFLNTRGLMIEEMKPVIKILNKMKTEREKDIEGNEKEYRPYEKIVQSAKLVSIYNLKDDDIVKKFIIPKVEEPEKDEIEWARITYLKPKSIVDKIKKIIKAKNRKEVGEKTFDYYVNMEEIEHE